MPLAQIDTPGLDGSSTNPFPDSFFERLLSTGELIYPGQPATGPVEAKTGQHQSLGLPIVNDISKLSLEQVPLADARVVVSPHGEPGDDDVAEGSLACLQLDAAPGQLYAFLQSSEMARFSFSFRGKQCIFYFDPNSDSLVMLNVSSSAMQASSLREHASEQMVDEHGLDPILIEPGGMCQIQPGPWRVSCLVIGGSVEMVADLLVFQRRYTVKRGLARTPTAGSKRKKSARENIGPSKRGRAESVAGGQGVVVLGSPPDCNNAFHTSLQLVQEGNVLLDLSPGQKVEILVPSSNNPTRDPSKEPAPSGKLQRRHDNYTLVHQRDIATGKGFASVFKAQHEAFGHVAVKVIRNKKEPQFLNIPRLARDWNNEQGLLSRIKHDSIIGFFGADARFYSIYMEYLPFPDLAKPPWRHLPGHFFSGTDDDAQRVVRDMSSALAYLHKKTIIHNDIKPANILFDRTRGPVLIDFGLASYKQGKPCSGGTPWYVPVEYLERDKRGYPSDVFALGITALYLLRRIPLPDATQQTWVISTVRSESSGAERMRSWLSIVQEEQERLSRNIMIERIVKSMLSNVERRISAIAAAEMLGSVLD